MITTTILERAFQFSHEGQDMELADPSSNFSPEAVLNFYAQTYPVLTTAKIRGPEISNDKVLYQFVSTIGTKG